MAAATRSLPVRSRPRSGRTRRSARDGDERCLHLAHRRGGHDELPRGEALAEPAPERADLFAEAQRSTICATVRASAARSTGLERPSNAPARSLDRRRHVGMPGEDDDLDPGVALLDPPEDLHAVAVGQADVEEDDVVEPPRGGFQSSGDGARPGRLVALRRKDTDDEGRERRVVFDDDARGGPSPAASPARPGARRLRSLVLPSRGATPPPRQARSSVAARRASGRRRGDSAPFTTSASSGKAGRRQSPDGRWSRMTRTLRCSSSRTSPPTRTSPNGSSARRGSPSSRSASRRRPRFAPPSESSGPRSSWRTSRSLPSTPSASFPSSARSRRGLRSSSSRGRSTRRRPSRASGRERRTTS